MAWKFKYNTLSDFFTDYQTSNGLWTEYGRVDSVQVTPYSSPETDGYVILFAVQPGSRIKNLNRFTFSRTQFLNLFFSKEVPGINLYISEEPNVRNTTSWDALTQLQKNDYLETALRLVANNYLRVYWPTEPPRSTVPIAQYSISASILNSGSTYVLPTSPLSSGEVLTTTITVRNVGVNPLSLLQAASLSSTQHYTIVKNFTKTNLAKDDFDTIQISFMSYELGLKESTISIRTNDPELPLFTQVLSTTVVENIGQLAPGITLSSTQPSIRTKGDFFNFLDIQVTTTRTYNDIQYIVVSEANGIEFIRWGNPPVSGSTLDYRWVPSSPVVSNTYIRGTVTDGYNQKTDDLEIKFLNKTYWGYFPSGTLTNSTVSFLDNDSLQETISGSYNFGVNTYGASNIPAYLYFTYPKAYGVVDYVEDLDNGFTYVPTSFAITEINFTNQFNYTEPYYVYRTNNKTFATDITWNVTLK
jgi:hypothetical protein